MRSAAHQGLIRSTAHKGGLVRYASAPFGFAGAWDLSPHKRLIARFEQYGHLAELSLLSQENHKLTAMLGNDCVIAPDIVVVRNTEPDGSINREELVVDESVARRASLRSVSGGLPLLHASISVNLFAKRLLR